MRRAGPRLLELVPGKTNVRAEVRVRARLPSGRLVSRRDNTYGCVGADLRDRIPITLSSAGGAALREGSRVRVELLLSDDAGHRARMTRTLMVADGARRRARRCAATRSVTLMRGADARVYLDRRSKIVGCSLTTARRTNLGSWFSQSIVDSASPRQGLTRLRLAGPYVAKVFVDEREGGRLAQLYIIDLRTGIQTYMAYANEGVGQYSDITDLEITAAGSVVFIDAANPARFSVTPTMPVVRRHDARGRAVLDATGQAVPYSLQLRHGSAQWQTAAGPATADIRAPQPTPPRRRSPR